MSLCVVDFKHCRCDGTPDRPCPAVERLRIGYDRYETVRLLSVPQFQDAYVLNRRTGKPFDEIIDDLRPFMRPQAGKATP